MSPEVGIADLLGTITPVTNLVGSRIYQLVLPQGTNEAAIRLQLIGEVQTYSHDGRDRTKRARIQVDSYAPLSDGNDPYADAQAVSDAIHGNGDRENPTGLDAYQGDVGSPAFRIRAIFSDGRSARFEEAELNLVRIQRDYMVHFYG